MGVGRGLSGLGRYQAVTTVGGRDGSPGHYRYDVTVLYDRGPRVARDRHVVASDPISWVSLVGDSRFYYASWGVDGRRSWGGSPDWHGRAVGFVGFDQASIYSDSLSGTDAVAGSEDHWAVVGVDPRAYASGQ